jgi:hypothetical protein
MQKNKKQRLMALGEDTLAQILLDLATHSDDVEAMIQRLIATPDEAVAQLKKKLASLKRSRRFIDWREAGHFANELNNLLDDIEANISDPFTGIKLVSSFLETDSSVFERCDDSSGSIGGIFAEAQDLFVDYAKRCEDKKKIMTLLLKLSEIDDYGARADLITCVAECGIPEPLMRSMIETFQQRADTESGDYKKRHHLLLIEFLARQLKDASLFEDTRIAGWGKPLGTAALINVAQVYFEQGDIDTAASRLSQIAENESFMSDDRERLWLDIYQRQGESTKTADLLQQRFHRYHSIDTLNALVEAIGKNKREGVITREISFIFEQNNLDTVDASFLLEINKIDEAEAYLLKHADQLNGSFYGSLLSLAEALDNEKRPLVVSLIYRSLLQSILERAYSKAYSHGVRYLKKLDALSIMVKDWDRFDEHPVYKEQLMQTHGRKRSFWSKYG